MTTCASIMICVVDQLCRADPIAMARIATINNVTVGSQSQNTILHSTLRAMPTQMLSVLIPSIATHCSLDPLSRLSYSMKIPLYCGTEEGTQVCCHNFTNLPRSTFRSQSTLDLDSLRVLYDASSHNVLSVERSILIE